MASSPLQKETTAGEEIGFVLHIATKWGAPYLHSCSEYKFPADHIDTVNQLLIYEVFMA